VNVISVTFTTISRPINVKYNRLI